jgi:diacylglycerol kinase
MPRPKKGTRTWPHKFADALRGIFLAFWRERSFHIHLIVAPLVLAAAIAVRVTLVEGCILGLCVALVFVTEMLNTGLEWLARAVHRRESLLVAYALEIGSGAVLLAAFAAEVIGGSILVYRLGVLLAWWA